MFDITSIAETRFNGRPGKSPFGPDYTGPCPWCGGNDRFHAYPEGGDDIPGIGNLGRFHCMDGNQGRGGCGRKGDMISYIQQRRGVNFFRACEQLGFDPQVILDFRRKQKGKKGEKQEQKHNYFFTSSLSEVSELWRKNAVDLARYASGQLQGVALDYLRSRGLDDRTIKTAVLGFYPQYKQVPGALWGDKGRQMRLPRGIVIPWFDENSQVLCVHFRRLPDDESDLAREYYKTDKTGKIKRYTSLSGSSSHLLYRADRLSSGCNGALFEGELDALVASQYAPEGCICLATGSTGWGKTQANVRKLAVCSQVLICFDNDQNLAGDKAAKYWLDALSNTKRWRPLWSDANEMAQDGVNLGAWLEYGLTQEQEAVSDEERCADCRMPISCEDRQFSFVATSEEAGYFFCSFCRDEQGQPWKTVVSTATVTAESMTSEQFAAIAARLQEVWTSLEQEHALERAENPTPEQYWERLRRKLGNFKADVPQMFLGKAAQPRTYAAPFPCYELGEVDGVSTLQVVGMWPTEVEKTSSDEMGKDQNQEP